MRVSVEREGLYAGIGGAGGGSRCGDRWGGGVLDAGIGGAGAFYMRGSVGRGSVGRWGVLDAGIGGAGGF